MATTRRQFIKQSAGAVAVGLVLPNIWLREARAQSTPRRRFVVIQLAGGNDGLNTVIPYTDSRYYQLRPTISFNENELRDSQNRSTIISDKFGLHPAMSAMKGLYDEGRVAIINGVGYPGANLSHFLSMDIWHTAELSGTTRAGWLGKYADIALMGEPGLTAASVGGIESPKSFYSNQVVIPNIINFSLYNFITDPAYPEDSNNQINTFSYAASRQFAQGSLMRSINSTGFEALGGAQRVQSSIVNYHSSVVYPEGNPLAAGMKMLAQLLTTIPEASLVYAQMGGFDTHADQIAHPNNRPDKLSGFHALLLRWFSEAVKAFYDDMVEHQMADDVLMMQWSEFGRRPDENASFGTDHGTTSPVFVLGNPVKGDVYGEYASLAASELDGAGNPAFKVDFRSVYATILDRWLGVDSREVLGASFENIGFLG
jgi:uncharacterized protein (DUF1501 family)